MVAFTYVLAREQGGIFCIRQVWRLGIKAQKVNGISTLAQISGGQEFLRWKHRLGDKPAAICLAKDNASHREKKGKTYSLAGKFLVIYI